MNMLHPNSTHQIIFDFCTRLPIQVRYWMTSFDGTHHVTGSKKRVSTSGVKSRVRTFQSLLSKKKFISLLLLLSWTSFLHSLGNLFFLLYSFDSSKISSRTPFGAHVNKRQSLGKCLEIVATGPGASAKTAVRRDAGGRKSPALFDVEKCRRSRAAFAPKPRTRRFLHAARAGHR